MPTFTLTDVARDLWIETFAVGSADLGTSSSTPWSVTKRTLRGGRRDGVDLIQVNNGALSFSVLPTRGMGIWKGQYRGDRLGWDSPIRDGPVNPAFVNLMNGGGIGWLEGFDEWLVRCGLENNGAPYEVKTVKPDGSESHTTFGLHGKIANLPASFVEVRVETEPAESITIEGHVDEARLFGNPIRMAAAITTAPGSNRLVVRDRFLNPGDSPGAMQVLYHWNFGAPYLEEGARLVAPIQTLVPRDPRAQEGLEHHDVYGGPTPGFTEQVYFMELHAGTRDGRTLVMLRNQAGDKGVVLRYAKQQLPAFTLWKSTGGRRSGYVTGLEPATNYPNARPFEEARRRVVILPPGGTYEVETTLEVLDTEEAVATVEEEIRAMQGRGAATIHRKPVEPFAPEDV
jgi:hypothetical protein